MAPAGRVVAHDCLLMMAGVFCFVCVTSRSALHYACSKGHRDIAQLLVAQGAEVNKLDEHSYSPLHRAAAKGDVQIMALLVDRGAKLNQQNKIKETPVPSF